MVIQSVFAYTGLEDWKNITKDTLQFAFKVMLCGITSDTKCSRHDSAVELGAIEMCQNTYSECHLQTLPSPGNVIGPTKTPAKDSRLWDEHCSCMMGQKLITKRFSHQGASGQPPTAHQYPSLLFTHFNKHTFAIRNKETEALWIPLGTMRPFRTSSFNSWSNDLANWILSITLANYPTCVDKKTLVLKQGNMDPRGTAVWSCKLWYEWIVRFSASEVSAHPFIIIPNRQFHPRSGIALVINAD